MIISCPSCSASFNVSPNALGKSGRTVKCSKCAHQWRALPEPETAEARVESASENDAPPANPGAGDPTISDAERIAASIAESVPESDGKADDSEAPADGADASNTADKADASEPEIDRAALDGILDADGADLASATTVPAEADRGADEDTNFGDGFPLPPGLGDDRSFGEDAPAGKTKSRRGGLLKVAALVALILLLAAAGGIGFFMQSQIVMWFPGASKIYAMIGMKPDMLGMGLRIIEPKPTKQIDGNDEILVVEGRIQNTADRALAVPLLRGALLDKEGKELHIWTFSAAKPSVAAGEQVDYRTRFRNPPAEAEKLDITFTHGEEHSSKNGAAKR